MERTFSPITPMQHYCQDFPFHLQNEIEAVRKVASFLNKDLPDDVIAAIADKCSFKNLKHAT